MAKVFGALCLNGTVERKHCEDCIWYDWDEAEESCRNRWLMICPIRVREIFPEPLQAGKTS